MYDISERLSYEAQRMHRAHKVAAMLASLENDMNALVGKEEDLRKSMCKEADEYQRISSKEGAAAFFYNLLGGLDKRIEKERCEAVAAQLKHEQCLHDIEQIRLRSQALQAEAETLADAEEAFTVLYAAKKELLKGDESFAVSMLDFDAERELSKNNSREIQEAVAAGENVLRALREGSGSLDSAASWGMWDILCGGLIATAIKHSRIKDANDAIRRAQSLLNSFKTELVDIDMPISVELEIGDFAYFADFFFDGLIADLYVQGKIGDSRDLIANTIRQIEIVLEKLTEMEEGELEKRAKLDEKIKQLVLQL